MPASWWIRTIFRALRMPSSSSLPTRVFGESSGGAAVTARNFSLRDSLPKSTLKCTARCLGRSYRTRIEEGLAVCRNTPACHFREPLATRNRTLLVLQSEIPRSARNDTAGERYSPNCQIQRSLVAALTGGVQYQLCAFAGCFW